MNIEEKKEIALVALREVIELGDISQISVEDLFYIQLYINDLQVEIMELESKYSNVNEYMIGRHK